MSPGIAIRCQRTINAPFDVVWEIVQDLPRWPEWDPYIVRLQRIDGGRGAAWEPGAQWVEQVRRGS